MKASLLHVQFLHMQNIYCISRFVVIVFVAIVFAMLIPLKILSGGYLPYDDALRHAAKAVSGKDWQDILVVREELWMDSHPGWHFFLEKIHSVFGVEQDFLVAFSIFFLFCMVVITGIVCVKFPEMFFLSLIPAKILEYPAQTG